MTLVVGAFGNASGLMGLTIRDNGEQSDSGLATLDRSCTVGLLFARLAIDGGRATYAVLDGDSAIEDQRLELVPVAG